MSSSLKFRLVPFCPGACGATLSFKISRSKILFLSWRLWGYLELKHCHVLSRIFVLALVGLPQERIDSYTERHFCPGACGATFFNRHFKHCVIFVLALVGLPLLQAPCPFLISRILLFYLLNLHKLFQLYFHFLIVLKSFYICFLLLVLLL